MYIYIYLLGWGWEGLEVLFLAPMIITVDWTFRKIIVQLPGTTFYDMAVMSYFI